MPKGKKLPMTQNRTKNTYRWPKINTKPKRRNQKLKMTSKTQPHKAKEILSKQKLYYTKIPKTDPKIYNFPAHITHNYFFTMKNVIKLKKPTTYEKVQKQELRIYTPNQKTHPSLKPYLHACYQYASTLKN